MTNTMKIFPQTPQEKSAFFAAKRAELAATPMLMSVVETPESIGKARVAAKIEELNARDAARSNPQ